MNEQEFINTLHKYREESAAVLAFEPSIERLIDTQHCKAIDKILNDLGTKWERRKAVPNLGNQLPAEKGLYMFVWKPDLVFRFAASGEVEQFSWVLYIGKAGIEDGKFDTIKSRYSSEYSKYVGGDIGCLWDDKPAIEREQKLARYLTLRPLEYWFLPIPTTKDIPLLERKLVRLLKPPLNNQHSGPRIKPGKTVPAF